MRIFIPDMKFLCLTLWLGGVCTDDTNNGANDDNNGQSMIVEGSLVNKPNEPRTIELSKTLKSDKN